MITDYIDFSFRQYFIVVNSQNGIKRLEDGPENHVETKKSRIWIKSGKFTNSLKKIGLVMFFRSDLMRTCKITCGISFFYRDKTTPIYTRRQQPLERSIYLIIKKHLYLYVYL